MSCGGNDGNSHNKQIVVLNDYLLINNQLVPRSSISNVQNNSAEYVQTEEPGDGETTDIILGNNGDDDSKFTWDSKSTLLFLDEYQKRVDSFRNPLVKKKTLWNSIATAMGVKGYDLDAATLDRKMRNMKCTFNKIKDNNRKKKTGRGRIVWEYYDRFCAIFAEDKTVNTTNVIASMAAPASVSATPEPQCSSSRNSSDCETPSNSREKQSKLDFLRKRQLNIEETRLEELKKIRIAIEESNNINREKLLLFKRYLDKPE